MLNYLNNQFYPAEMEHPVDMCNGLQPTCMKSKTLVINLRAIFLQATEVARIQVAKIRELN